MCDICEQEGVNELAFGYVLTKRTTRRLPGTRQSIQRTTVIARVHASVCERCYREETGEASDPSANERGLRAALKRWYQAMFPLSKEQVVESLAYEKLDELYPRQTLAVGPWNVTIGRGSEYEVQRADLWDEQRRRSWQ